MDYFEEQQSSPDGSQYCGADSTDNEEISTMAGALTSSWTSSTQVATTPSSQSSTDLLDAMSYIQSTDGRDGLRAFLNRLPTAEIEALLATSEMSGGYNSNALLNNFNDSAAYSAASQLPRSQQQHELQLLQEYDSVNRRRDELLAAMQGPPRFGSSMSTAPTASSAYFLPPPPAAIGRQVSHPSQLRINDPAGLSQGTLSYANHGLHQFEQLAPTQWLPEQDAIAPRVAEASSAASSREQRLDSLRIQQQQLGSQLLNNSMSLGPHHPKPSSSVAPTCLSVESDRTFLDPIHNFLRSSCIEVFIATQSGMTSPGRGARPTKIGQIGLRCVHCKGKAHINGGNGKLARQALCFPSRRDTIFESVRNYQRVHLEACVHVPNEAKAAYRNMVDERREGPLKKSQKILKAYYAEAALDLGLVDGQHGLEFDASSVNTSRSPSERLQTMMRAAESPSEFASYLESASSLSASKKFSRDDKELGMRKFEKVASEGTRMVIVNARKHATAFVKPQDFPTTSDLDFLLFHQVGPFKPGTERLEQRGLNTERYRNMAGLCCRHCARAMGNDNEYDCLSNRHKGVYFPSDLASISDSTFSQTLKQHVMACPNVPDEIKVALVELRRLAVEYGISARRGSKKNFITKIWRRMERYYEDSNV